MYYDTQYIKVPHLSNWQVQNFFYPKITYFMPPLLRVARYKKVYLKEILRNNNTKRSKEKPGQNSNQGRSYHDFSKNEKTTPSHPFGRINPIYELDQQIHSADFSAKFDTSQLNDTTAIVFHSLFRPSIHIYMNFFLDMFFEFLSS